jgi:hypothetical protein
LIIYAIYNIEIVRNKIRIISISLAAIIIGIIIIESLFAIRAYKETIICNKVASYDLSSASAVKEAVEKCKLLENKKFSCFGNIANKIDDIELCKDIPDNLIEFKCVYRIVIEKGDPTLCDKYVSFSEHKYQYPDCITDIAEKNKDPEICKLHDESKYKGHLNYEYIMRDCIRKATIEKPETVDETADWKTYRNTKYGYDGYEVKYPKDWFIEEKKDLVNFYNQNPKTYEFKRTREISSGIFDYPKEDFIFQINVIHNVTPELNLVQKKPITISGINGVQGILIGGEGEKILTAHLIRTNKTLVFYGRPADSTFANFFNQILSTFKFIK